MQAWIFTDEKSPLELREVPDPTPGAGEVVVDLQAAGLCHSDIGFMDGTLTGVLGKLPIILGHEAAGIQPGKNLGGEPLQLVIVLRGRVAEQR